jgi:hypothetical protein
LHIFKDKKNGDPEVAAFLTYEKLSGAAASNTHQTQQTRAKQPGSRWNRNWL